MCVCLFQLAGSEQQWFYAGCPELIGIRMAAEGLAF